MRGRFSITSSGAALASGGVVCYAGGVLLGYPTLVHLAVGALAILVAGALTMAVRPMVTLSRRVTPDRVTVGEQALGQLLVRNVSRWPAPGFAAVDVVGGEPVTLQIGVLVGFGQRAVRYPIPAQRRGRLLLGPLTVERSDPLRLFVWRQRQTADGVLWVHPRVHPLRPLPVGVVLDYEGRTTQHARPGTVTFSSLREYVPGDDPRQIHWRSTARTGTLIVREHVDTTEPTTTVVLDTRTRALDAESFEHAVEFAASLVRAVEETGRPVALHVVGEHAGDALAAGATGSLDRLAMAERLSGMDSVLLIETVDRIPPGGALAVVTGSIPPGELAKLAAQRNRYSPVVVAMVDPQSDAGVQRRPGMALLTASTAAEAATAWHRMVNGDAG
ncbi:DUF58 domain-containing protein [Allorhizocola rhizosphaerae]|uniref:DUF58 domain-containing protein n=1 Tax=Allorhizocola rhizosphaerae TaxID=1872709 RepID=UPI000E3C2770|nr:DUF58 domain-containing protein [Allorhizocola rhizosphaerae]